ELSVRFLKRAGRPMALLLAEHRSRGKTPALLRHELARPGRDAHVLLDAIEHLDRQLMSFRLELPEEAAGRQYQRPFIARRSVHVARHPAPGLEHPILDVRFEKSFRSKHPRPRKNYIILRVSVSRAASSQIP